MEGKIGDSLYHYEKITTVYYRFGASIFAATETIAEAFQRIPYNPQCFFVLESSSTLPPMEWGQVYSCF